MKEQIEFSNSNWISIKQLAEDLGEMNMSNQFKKELLVGYSKSDFYKQALKTK